MCARCVSDFWPPPPRGGCPPLCVVLKRKVDYISCERFPGGFPASPSFPGEIVNETEAGYARHGFTAGTTPKSRGAQCGGRHPARLPFVGMVAVMMCVQRFDVKTLYTRARAGDGRLGHREGCEGAIFRRRERVNARSTPGWPGSDDRSHNASDPRGCSAGGGARACGEACDVTGAVHGHHIGACTAEDPTSIGQGSRCQRAHPSRA